MSYKNNLVYVFFILSLFLFLIPNVSAIEVSTLEELGEDFFNYCSADLWATNQDSCKFVVYCDGGLVSSTLVNHYYATQNDLLVVSTTCNLQTYDPNSNPNDLPSECNPLNFEGSCGIQNCDYTNGLTVNTNSPCNCNGPTTSSSNPYCCFATSQVSDSEITDCSQTTQTGTVTGNVNFVGNSYGVSINGIGVTIGGQSSVTNSAGSFIVNNVQYGSQTANAQVSQTINGNAITCSGSTQISVPDQTVVSIGLECTQVNANPNECVPNTCYVEQAGYCGYVEGQPTLQYYRFDYTLEEYCDLCSDYSGCSQDCTPGACNALDHQYCDDGTWMSVEELGGQTAYCNQCMNQDPWCQDLQCAPSTACDGNANACNDVFDDPDAQGGLCTYTLPIGHDLFGVYPALLDASYRMWCDSSASSWLVVDSFDDVDREEYCSKCPGDVFYCQGVQAQCGDGVVTPNSAEECDLGSDASYADWEAANCRYPGTFGECTLIDANSCNNDGVWDIGLEECDGSAGNCAQGQECNAECDCVWPGCDFNNLESIVESLTVVPFLCDNKVSVQVSFNSDCLEHISSVKLLQSSNDGVSFAIIRQTNDLPVGQDFLVFENIGISADTNYLYKLELTSVGSLPNQEIGFYPLESGIAFTSGSSECVNWNSINVNSIDQCQVSNCDDSGNLNYCSGLDSAVPNQLVIDETCEGSCYYSEDGATCSDGPSLDLDSCTKCMGMTGFFYSNEMSLLLGEDSVNCANIFRPLNLNGVSECFFDVGFSSMDQAKSCSQVTSCYDYKSIEACESGEGYMVADPCKVGGEQGCEWAHYNEQTGKGVCRPVSVDMQDCSKAIDPKYNSIFIHDTQFLTYVTSERICEQLFGSECYYSFTDTSNCLNLNELTCEDLQTQNDCVGFTDDVANEYSFNPQTFEFNADNMPSSPFAQNTKCAWIEDSLGSRCIRDADVDGLNDPYEWDFYPSFFTVNSDQFLTIQQKRDFQAPQTNLINFPEDSPIFGSNLGIEFFVEDNVYDELGYQTFFCLSDVSSGSGMGQSAENICDPSRDDAANYWVKANDGVMLTNVNEGGTYNLYYFSVDNGLNLEVIQSKVVEINAQGPQINPTYDFETYELLDGNFLTDLSIQYEINSYSQAYCELSLANPDGSLREYVAGSGVYHIEELIQNGGSSTSITYQGLEDGLYTVNIECEDVVLGNVETLSQTIRVQADTRIFDVTPQYDPYKQVNVDFEIKTENVASECYYALDNLKYVSDYANEDIGSFEFMKTLFETSTVDNNFKFGKFETTNNAVPYVHQANNIDFSSIVNEDGELVSGLFIYNVACQIEVYNPSTQEVELKTIEKNPMHRIILSQDYESPVINVMVKDKAQEGFIPLINDYWYSWPEVELNCKDKNVFIDYLPNILGYVSDETNLVLNTFKVNGQEVTFGCASNFEYCKSHFGEEDCINNLNTLLHPHTETLQDLDCNGDSSCSSPTSNNAGYSYSLCYSVLDQANPPNNFERLCRTVNVDNQAPNSNLFRVYRQSDPTLDVQEITLGFYEIAIEVNEPVAFSSLSLEVPSESISVELPTVYNQDSNTVLASFIPHNFEQLSNLDDEINFKISLIDEHGKSRILHMSGFNLNTQLPADPELEPVFNNFHKAYGIVESLSGVLFPMIYQGVYSSYGITLYDLLNDLNGDDFDNDVDETNIDSDVDGEATPGLDEEQDDPHTEDDYSGQIDINQVSQLLSETFFVNDLNMLLTGFSDAIKFELHAFDMFYENEHADTLVDIYEHSNYQKIDESVAYTTVQLLIDLDNVYNYNKQGDTRIYFNLENPNLLEKEGFAITLPYVLNNGVGMPHAIGKRTEHGHYSQFYEVVSIGSEDLSGVGAGPIVNYYELNTPLQDDLVSGGLVNLYSPTIDLYPESYFSLSFNDGENQFDTVGEKDLTYKVNCGPITGGNLYKVFVTSIASSLVESSMVPQQVFLDDVSPVVTQIDSPQGTYAYLDPVISFTISEASCGSGLDYKNSYLKFIKKSDGQVFRSVPLDQILVSVSQPSSGVDVDYVFEYNSIQEPLVNDEFTVLVDVQDFANNDLVGGSWDLTIDDQAPSTPEVNVLNIDSEYGYYTGVYFVNEAPEIKLTFEDPVQINSAILKNVGDVFDEDGFAIPAEVDGSESDDGTSLDSSTSILICGPYDEEGTEFICTLPEDSQVTDGYYVLELSAFKLDSLSNVPLEDHPGSWSNIRISIDTTVPSFEIVDAPIALQPSGELSIGPLSLLLNNPELDLIVRVSSADPSALEEISDYYEISGASHSADYLTFGANLNVTFFEWVTNTQSPYTYRVQVFDRAMNEFTVNNNLWVDDVDPIIDITEFSSANGVSLFDPLNLEMVTNDVQIIIEGNVDDSMIKHVCLDISSSVSDIPFAQCQYPCEDGETQNCISDDNAFEFSFTLSFESIQNYGGLVWNYIDLIATDEAFNKATESLSALLDLKPPELGGVTVE